MITSSYFVIIRTSKTQKFFDFSSPKPCDLALPKMQVHNFIYRLIISKFQASSLGDFRVFVHKKVLNRREKKNNNYFLGENKQNIIFPGENNTRLLPVPFHHHSPLHTLKVTDISVKLNRMQCNQTDFDS